MCCIRTGKGVNTWIFQLNRSICQIFLFFFKTFKNILSNDKQQWRFWSEVSWRVYSNSYITIRPNFNSSTLKVMRSAIQQNDIKFKCNQVTVKLNSCSPSDNFELYFAIKYTKIRQHGRSCQIRVYLNFLFWPRDETFSFVPNKSNDYNTTLANKYSRGINICDENPGLNELMHQFHLFKYESAF